MQPNENSVGSYIQRESTEGGQGERKRSKRKKEVWGEVEEGEEVVEEEEQREQEVPLQEGPE